MCSMWEGEVVNNACVGRVKMVCGRGIYLCMVISIWRYRSAHAWKQHTH